MKLQQSKGRYFLSVPKQYVILLGWKKGDSFIFIPSKEGTLEIKKMPEQV